jgi:hypothetical protein
MLIGIETLCIRPLTVTSEYLYTTIEQRVLSFYCDLSTHACFSVSVFVRSLPLYEVSARVRFRLAHCNALGSGARTFTQPHPPHKADVVMLRVLVVDSALRSSYSRTITPRSQRIKVQQLSLTRKIKRSTSITSKGCSTSIMFPREQGENHRENNSRRTHDAPFRETTQHKEAPQT